MATTRKVAVSKKTAATKKVAASKPVPKSRRQSESENKELLAKARQRAVDTAPEKTDDEQIVWTANDEAKKHGVDNSKPAKIHAKSLSVNVSIGTYDRERSIEDFIADVMERLGAVPYGKEGLHANVMSHHYIIDGQVCMPEDYDPKKQHFKDGKMPPAWAGGPSPKKLASSTTPTPSSRSAISAKAYDEKYGPEGNPSARGKIAAQKERRRLETEGPRDDEIEDTEFEWDEGDFDDDAAHEETSKRTVKRAAKKLATAPKKTVARKVATSKKTASASPAPRKVVRRKK